MRILTGEGKLERMTKAEAKERGFLQTQPIYVYVLRNDVFAEPYEIFFLTEKLKFSKNLKDAKMLQGFWKLFCFDFKARFCELPILIVNISPYLQALKERWKSQ